MDIAAELQKPPFSELEDAIRQFAVDALTELGDFGPSEAAEVLAPFLLDAGLASDEAEAAVLCAGLGNTSSSSPAADSKFNAKEPELRESGAICIASLSSKPENDETAIEAETVGEAAGTAAVKASSAGKSRARLAAQADEAAKAALAPGAKLELRQTDSENLASQIAKVLRSEWPSLAVQSEDGAPRSDFLAASFIAYSEERSPERLQQFVDLLTEVLADAGVELDVGELDAKDTSAAIRKMVELFAKRGFLQAQEWEPEVGDQVLAVLPEDDEWHLAIVDGLIGGEHGKVLNVKLIFIEYGKPMTAALSDIRALEDVIDEDAGEGKEGECEMCKRAMFLTFHHLIPKDVHPTYLGKRLPRGIEGEPTRGFLNTYGLMICRHCHSTVHRIASNNVLAVEYNTLEKIMAHETIKVWVGYASKQRVPNRRNCCH
eukprot:TRINITY_DN50447_c0_g1_i1.p1 TRINITY_DN50447_c0_g1~~TRINITY_DN50447_c0_g1_i1.p1  ORF type:complete len:450 (-),score=113.08 TRINITY_DN50447_c0_g1_i1:91-1389(-)